MYSELPKQIEVAAILAPSDAEAVRNIVKHSNWSLRCYDTLYDARARIVGHKPAVFICSNRMEGGHSWKELLTDFATMSNPPELIISCHLADENLWAEALHYGAFDVLQSPYEPHEVIYSISAAWRRWNARERLAHCRSATWN